MNAIELKSNKKVATSLFLHQPPFFRVTPPLSSDIFGTPTPKGLNFWKVLTEGVVPTMDIFNNLVKGEHRSNIKTGGAYTYLLQSFGGDIRFILNQSCSSIGPVFTNSLVLGNTNFDS